MRMENIPAAQHSTNRKFFEQDERFALIQTISPRVTKTFESIERY